MQMIRSVSCLILLALVAGNVVAQKRNVGVIVLAHGAGPQWNQQVNDATKGIAAKYPTEVAFGMALPRTMQLAIDKLEARGVDKIVVVPLFISSHSFIIRQSEYLLGLRQELAEPPVVMDHGSNDAMPNHAAYAVHGSGHGTMMPGNSNHGSGHVEQATSAVQATNAQPSTLPRLVLHSEIKFTRSLDDHPLVARILADRIKELSKEPSKEVVVLVGHGPNPEDDNKKWVTNMESLASQIGELQRQAGNQSKMILAMTVRDDAEPAIYNQAKENLRSLVNQASKQGTVIVIPVFLSSGSVEQKVAARLDGLTYTWNGKTLLPDPRIAEFITLSVEHALK